MAKPPRKVTITPLSPEEATLLCKRLDEATRKYGGTFEELESALGMMVLGRLFGWKVLVLMHNKRTIRKYEEILGINVREEFPEEGPLTYKSYAFEFIQKAGEFWKGVSGDTKIPDRRALNQ